MQTAPLPTITSTYSLLFTLSVWTALHWTMFVTSTVEWLYSEWCLSVCGCQMGLHMCTCMCQATQPIHGEIKIAYDLLPSASQFLWSHPHHLTSPYSRRKSVCIRVACFNFILFHVPFLFNLWSISNLWGLISCRPICHLKRSRYPIFKNAFF